MPVFDFSNRPDENRDPVCTYTAFRSEESNPSPEKPILLLDNSARKLPHHSHGMFMNPIKRTSFECKDGEEVFQADILQLDSRFISLLKWLGENHIHVCLSGENRPEGYAVYRIRETAFGNNGKLSAEDGFLQFMIDRLLACSAPSEEEEDTPEYDESIVGKWIVNKKSDENGNSVYYFELFASNGEKLLSSEEYTTYIGAINGISTHRANIEKDNFRISLTKRGEYIFKILSGNGQLLCLGEHYRTKTRCQNAVESVKRFAKNAPVFASADCKE